MNSLSSPCVGICTLNGERCVGCSRTLEEIKDWGEKVLQKRKKASMGRDKCPSCRKENNCAMERGKTVNACWCFNVSLHKDLPLGEETSCLCGECLHAVGDYN